MSAMDLNYHKVVQQWEDEHKRLVVLGTRVLKLYEEGDTEKTREALREFAQAAREHFKSEFIQLTALFNSHEFTDRETKEAIRRFKTTFQETQKTLLKFLAIHCRPGHPLDRQFITTFSTIMGLLGERVQFEESDLYRRLKIA